MKCFGRCVQVRNDWIEMLARGFSATLCFFWYLVAGPILRMGRNADLISAHEHHYLILNHPVDDLRLAGDAHDVHVADSRDQDTSESDLSTIHVLKSLVGIIKLELLDHALDTVDFCKVDGILAVHSVT